MDIKVFVVLLCVLIGKSAGQLRCYACSFSTVDSDRSCLTVTNDTRSVECPFAYCTIYRQEFLDPPGEIASFARGCEDEPDFLNHEITDYTFRTFYRACTSDFCNVGNGIQSIGGGNLSPTPLHEGENILVPGTGNGAIFGPKLYISIFTMFIIYLI